MINNMWEMEDNTVDEGEAFTMKQTEIIINWGGDENTMKMKLTYQEILSIVQNCYSRRHQVQHSSVRWSGQVNINQRIRQDSSYLIQGGQTVDVNFYNGGYGSGHVNGSRGHIIGSVVHSGRYGGKVGA